MLQAYGEIDVLEDDIEMRALLSHIKTCGQVPKQLLTYPHPTTSSTNKTRKKINASQHIQMFKEIKVYTYILPNK